MSQFDSIRFQGSRPLLKEVTADRLNAIVSEIRRNKPKGERGITVRHSGDATYIGLAKNFQGSTTTATRRLPWDIYVSETDESGNYTVKVEPGLAGGFLPANWDDEFVLPQETLCFGKAILATDGERISSVAIAIDDTPPAQQTPQLYSIETTVELLFGLFLNGSSYNVTNGFLPAMPKVYLISEKSVTALPGQSPYELRYTVQ